MTAKGPAFIEFFAAIGVDVVFPGIHTRAMDDETPVDLSGKTIRVKVQKKDGTVVVEKAAALGATLPDGTFIPASQGGYNWALTHAETISVPAGLYGLDIFTTDNGAQDALVIGTLKLGNDVRYGTWIL